MRQVENRKSAKHEKATKLGAKKTAPVDLPLDSNISHQIIDGVKLANAGMAHGVVTVASADDQGSGHSGGGGLGSAGLIIGGLAVAGGIGVAASGGSTVTVPTPTPAPAPVAVTPAPLPLDTTPPVFVSGATSSVNDNSPAGISVYTARAEDNQSTVTYSIANTGDGALFSIDPVRGSVTSKVAIDYEDPNNPDHQFTITVIATDAIGNATNQTVVINVVDQPEGSYSPTYNILNTWADIPTYVVGVGSKFIGYNSSSEPVYNAGNVVFGASADITSIAGLRSYLTATLGLINNQLYLGVNDRAYLIKVVDNQATPGTDYSGYYLAVETNGAFNAFDGFDGIVKLTGGVNDNSKISWYNTQLLTIA